MLITYSLSIWSTAAIGYPLKYFAPELYHVWIDVTKQSFGIFLTTLNQLWTPCEITITGDRELEGLFSLNEDGTLKTKFDERAILMANHQLYSDWAYLWWVAFTAKLHGALYIMLKASLKNIPIVGWGMQHYRFIFLTRKWQEDEKILNKSLTEINEEKNWPAWLVLFPEGTTFSKNGYDKTVSYAKKTDVAVPKHVLLPRSTGLRYSLSKLDDSVEYLYDATIHYAGMQKEVYGEDYFTLKAIYFTGVYPKHVSIYWRRYRVKDIPYQDEEAFTKWIQDRWYEKDQILDRMIQTGSFGDDQMKPLRVPVKLNSLLQTFQIISVPLNVVLIISLLKKHVPNLIRAFQG